MPNSNSGGVTESSVLREGRGCECGLTFWAINQESPLRKQSEIHRRMFSPRAAESQETIHLRDAFVYTDRCLFRGSGKKG
jgi:hypothetical protein